MTKAMAYKILGITSGTALTDIKKKYRQLMHRVHPDTEAFSTRAYDFTAQEINEAYDFLRKNMPEERLGKADLLARYRPRLRIAKARCWWR